MLRSLPLYAAFLVLGYVAGRAVTFQARPVVRSPEKLPAYWN